MQLFQVKQLRTLSHTNKLLFNGNNSNDTSNAKRTGELNF